MVKGIKKFKEYFKGFEDQYTIIGGTACDLLLTSNNITARTTKDIDLVLIIEAITPKFGIQLWDFIEDAGYEHRNKSTNKPEFYRFYNPKSIQYPTMIEIFTKKSNFLTLPEKAILSPVPFNEEISSLSAILLDEAYYNFLKTGMTIYDEISILDAIHLIPFKAKAWLDLTQRKLKGELIDSKNIKKHKNDIYRLSQIISKQQTIELEKVIFDDMQKFLQEISQDPIDLTTLHIYESHTSIIQRLSRIYKLK